MNNMAMNNMAMNNKVRKISDITFSGLLHIPEAEPEIKYITSIKIIPVLNKAYIKKEKLVFHGVLMIDLEYMPARGLPTKKKLAFRVPFGHLANLTNTVDSFTLKILKEYHEFSLVSRKSLKVYVLAQVIQRHYTSA